MQQELIQENDFFSWKGIRIYQDPEVHKVGTDALLLGSWIPRVVSDVQIILDAGTGSGILALMMATFFTEAKIKAIDIDERAYQLALLNVRYSGWSERIEVKMENITHPPFEENELCDLVVSNPPFYTSQHPPKDEFKARAKHSVVSEIEWMKGMASRLKNNGQMAIVVPSETAVTWIRAANAIGYYNLNRMDIFAFTNDLSPKRTLLHFNQSLEKPRMCRLAILTADHQYTSEYLELSGIVPTPKKNH